MSIGLAVFDTTVQDTNEWLSGLEAQLPPCSRQQAYGALRAVFHVLRDRLTIDAVLGLSAQLPMLLRGVFMGGVASEATIGPARSGGPRQGCCRRLAAALPA